MGFNICSSNDSQMDDFSQITHINWTDGKRNGSERSSYQSGLFIFFILSTLSLHKTSVSLGTFSFSFEKQYALRPSCSRVSFKLSIILNFKQQYDWHLSVQWLCVSSNQVLSLRPSLALEKPYLELRLCELLFASLASKPGIPH